MGRWSQVFSAEGYPIKQKKKFINIIARITATLREKNKKKVKN